MSDTNIPSYPRPGQRPLHTHSIQHTHPLLVVFLVAVAIVAALSYGAALYAGSHGSGNLTRPGHRCAVTAGRNAGK